jgi:integral membrane protein (TIGR00529 family)
MIEVFGLIIAFSGIFLLRVKKVDFFLAITLAALIIGMTSDQPNIIIFRVFVTTLSNSNTWNLASAVALISILGYVLKETGLMIKFVEELSLILPSKIMLATIPAVFGFLSIPGGALMSAPFIEPETKKLELRSEEKTYFNVWFRHLLYWVSPITSSTIMATTLTGFTINRWLRIQAPLFFVMLIIGFYTSRGFIKIHRKKKEITRINIENISGGLPIIITVIFALSGLAMWLSLLIGVFAAMIIGRLNPKQSFNMLKKGVRWDLMLTIISMLYLRDMIEASGSVPKLFETIFKTGIPLVAIAIIIPLFIGAISGSPAMGVGIAFPILLPLLGEQNIHLASIIFLGITCAYITSPLHLCLVLTNSYFKSDMNKVIRYLSASSFSLYIAGLTYHLFLHLF